jgi:hypothetical protein
MDYGMYAYDGHKLHENSTKDSHRQSVVHIWEVDNFILPRRRFDFTRINDQQLLIWYVDH